MSFVLNDKIVEIDEPLGSSTLDFLRKTGLTGVKEACHEGECGACMILLGELQGSFVKYKAVTSCILPLGEVVGKHVVTIEGLNQEKLNPIQEEMVEKGAVQCGFCTPGFVVALTGHFLSEDFHKQDILESIEGNICRCGTYAAMRRAALELEKKIKIENEDYSKRVDTLITLGVLPAYFAEIPEKLQTLKTEAEEVEAGTLVAGATDLLVQHEKIDKPVFLSKKGISDKIWVDEDYVYIGARATMEQIRLSEKLNEMYNISKDLTVVSSLPVRNMATVGGNLINASPIGDLIIYFLALDAEISLRKGDKNRIVKLKDFYLDYKVMDIKEGEAVEWLRFTKRKKYFNFEKVALRKYVDIASVNSAISFQVIGNKLHDVHVSAGGVAPVPKYLKETSSFLEGKEPTPEVIAEATKIADREISPISDVRGTAKYKRLLLRQLLYAHFIKLFPELEVQL